MSTPVSKKAENARSNQWKLAAGGAAAAMYLAPGATPSAEATIVHVSTPISIQFGGASAPWDVDGVGGADFTLAVSTIGSYQFLSINGGGPNGAFINKVGATEDGIEGFAPTASQFDIGPVLAPGYFFGVNNATYRTMMIYDTFYASKFLGPDALGWAAPTQFVGFRFDATKYGWASVTLDTTLGKLTINEWAYDDAGGAIHLGSVPEPGSGLALLACGAAGLRRWNRRKSA